MYEGDIFLTKGMEGPADLSSAGDVDEDLSLRSKRNAVRDRKRLWTNKIIPYQFESGFPNDLRPTILEAMEEYHKKTCLRFKERTDERYFLRFVNKKGCWSSVGRSYWVEDVGQEVSLGSGCNDKKIIMHELMHAIGFWHEQSRPDRNKYVEVLWENIQEGEAHNFNKYSHGEIDTLQVPYDFDSIMHYGRTSFGKDGLETIRAIHDPGRELGRVIPAFTELDLREINALYNCRPGASFQIKRRRTRKFCVSECDTFIRLRQRNQRVNWPDMEKIRSLFVHHPRAACSPPIPLASALFFARLWTHVIPLLEYDGGQKNSFKNHMHIILFYYLPKIEKWTFFLYDFTLIGGFWVFFIFFHIGNSLMCNQ
ncbi:predicted protein [Nematostella vectensis]|uniref:Metalloendopeptidase n=1 Tax=Nematostella vectensis TaxID=45351 RepID=A7RVF7_NEMVE|nr:predicted protein [Nematostella vectensis]|eukprot:XP_001636631.1 predicted protein [Nematostella vectensis]